MNDDEFEWDQAKARRNYAKHGVTFHSARKAFADSFMVEVLDDREDYGEERFLIIGMGRRSTGQRHLYSSARQVPPDLGAARDQR